jgi:putative protein-disulfide isomerase
VAKLRIIYVWDPLCGWCFAFASIIDRIREKFSLQAEFEILSGGLAIRERAGPISQKAAYLKKRMADVERIGKVRFGKNYIRVLEEGTQVSDSLPPSIGFKALCSFRQELAFDFARQIQDAHFLEGRDLNGVKSYLGICESCDINKHAFMERFSDPVYRSLTENDFQLTRSWGVEKYPALVLQKEDVTILQKGYAGYRETENVLKKALAGEQGSF